MKSVTLMALVVMGVTGIAGCTVPPQQPQPVTVVQPRFADNTVDEQDLNDEAFDLAWYHHTNGKQKLRRDLCMAAQIAPDSMWLAFDEGSQHTFPRAVFDRGVNRHCS